METMLGTRPYLGETVYATNHLSSAVTSQTGRTAGTSSGTRSFLAAVKEALKVGGGIKGSNSKSWIEAGAERHLDSTLRALDQDRSKLMVDLSCRRTGDSWFVAMNEWQTVTEFEVNEEHVRKLKQYCSEFLIHAADVEGLQKGIDEDLCTLPITYAGGAKSVNDLQHVKELSSGRTDLTIGSALDIFGSKLVSFDECVKFNQGQGNT
ncbi:hypothetical protein K431DRAFT_318685 [Polychaeton citri CBS 116435]|uniref:Phosphoribosylformimino-5-aminoimidazole carboxamide ribotide isomerase n=1 Tax=Polychaeton citri CBS 116435 TaxID=1314669 RepID=A0A9P4QAY5_9PEZI|nr:hypothetical protein K431DRAFT_318685 [Polychaeton citri CBS 116435]